VSFYGDTIYKIKTPQLARTSCSRGEKKRIRKATDAERTWAGETKHWPPAYANVVIEQEQEFTELCAPKKILAI